MSDSQTSTIYLAAATLFISGCASQSNADRSSENLAASGGGGEIIKCIGVNECKGQGQCAMKAPDGSDLNVCGGQNSCQGKGWLELSADECGDKGGTIEAGSERKGGSCEASPANRRLTASAAQEHYNLERDKAEPAIEGYDPVAYFEEGGGKAMPGLPEFSATHEGVTYLFANAEHREKFLAQPERYEPAFGGWCAYAMGKTGRKVSVDPESFLIENDQLLLFYRTRLNNTRDKWQEDDRMRLRDQADLAWYEHTGECEPAGLEDSGATVLAKRTEN